MAIKVIGLDIAKSVLQVHGVDEAGQAVLRRKLRRCDVLKLFAGIEPALVGIEACHTGHYWAREIAALGHEVRLMPPQFVKPYVKSQKNDAADAEAICEAVQRPTMRFVPVKSAEQQAALLLHRTRDLLVRQRSSLVSAILAHFAEFGIVVYRRARDIDRLLALLADSQSCLPRLAREMLSILAAQLREIDARVQIVEAELMAWHRSNGKERLGSISKRGDGYIRRLMIHGARAIVGWRRRSTRPRDPWIDGLLSRRHINVATVALANKSARVAWALMVRESSYNHRLARAA